MIVRILFCFLALTQLTSCIYRMPEDDEFRCVPLTNNPNITLDKGNLSIPGMN
jgi:hypothetical protein